MRRDKGKYQLTPRDIRILSFISQQYVVRLDQFRVLMTRFSEYEFDDLIAYSTAMDRVYKLQDAGYIHYARVLAQGPGWIWATRHGLDAVGYSFTAKPPSWRSLPHLYAINQVRLYGNWAYWRSERFIRQTKQVVIPDGIAWETQEDYDNNREIAIEVEISLKSVSLRKKKLSDLIDVFHGYQRVKMFVPNETIYQAMDRARQKLRDPNRVDLILQPSIDPNIPDYL